MPQSIPTLVVIGQPEWLGAVEAAAEQEGFKVVALTEQAGYVNHLTDVHAGLVVVDGDAEGWAWWPATTKASPATRRIPVVVVSQSAEVREAAPGHGADFHLAPNLLETDLPRLLREHARLQRDDERAQLIAQCAEPLPPRARQAVEQFNSGEYYKQHDLFEELWMEEEGPVRDLYRAILQVGVAYYQVQRRNRRGAYKMLLRSVQWLNILPDACQGVDIAQLRADVAALRAAIEALPDDADMSQLEGYLKPVPLIESA